MTKKRRIISHIFGCNMVHDTPGLVGTILYLLLRAFYSLYIIYERVQITP